VNSNAGGKFSFLFDFNMKTSAMHTFRAAALFDKKPSLTKLSSIGPAPVMLMEVLYFDSYLALSV